MKFETLIEKIKNLTINAIRNEDWDYLFQVLEREPKQLIYYSEEIEKILKRSKILDRYPFELITYKDKPNDDKPKYYRFIPGLQLILTLIRDYNREFSKKIKQHICDILFPKLKDEFGYSSTLDLFYTSLHSEIISGHINDIIEYPQIIEKIIKFEPDKITHLYPQFILKDKTRYYNSAYKLVVEKPELIKNYRAETIQLLENIILYEEQYTDFLKLLEIEDPSLIPFIERKRKDLKSLYYNKLMQSKKDSIDLIWFSKNFNIFRYTLYLYSDEEFSNIIKKIIDLDFHFNHDNNDVHWINLVLLTIIWYNRANLFQDYLESLIQLNHIQVVKTFFMRNPEKIRQSQELILGAPNYFMLELLEKHYESFDFKSPVTIFISLLKNNIGYVDKTIKIFFDNNEDLIHEFKNEILVYIKEIIEKDNEEINEDNNRYFFQMIQKLFDYVYIQYPETLPKLDLNLIQNFYNWMLSRPLINGYFNIGYNFFLRENFKALEFHIQQKIISQLVKDGAIPIIEFYLTQNLEIFAREIDILLTFNESRDNDSGIIIRPLEYILRKTFTDTKILTKILEKVNKLRSTKRKVELYIFLGDLYHSEQVLVDLISEEFIIPDLINLFVEYKLVEIERLIEKHVFIDINNDLVEIPKIEQIFETFNSRNHRKQEFYGKYQNLKARLYLYDGFESLKDYHHDNAISAFQEAYLIYRALSELDTITKINKSLFRLYSQISATFNRIIPLIKDYMKDKHSADINRANLIIKKHIEIIINEERVSNPQILRALTHLKNLQINPDSNTLIQIKTEIATNFCPKSPEVRSVRLMDENRDVIIEWEKNKLISESKGLIIPEVLSKLFLEVRFANSVKAYDFKAYYQKKPFIEILDIKQENSKGGMVSYEIWLRIKRFSGENYLNLYLIENTICGFQIPINLPIIYDLSILDEKDIILRNKIKRMDRNIKMDIDILIYSPTFEELKEIREILPNSRLDNLATTSFPLPYDIGTIIIGENKYTIIVISPHIAGQRKAQTFITKALQVWTPKYVILTGVAGGFKDIKIGDILLPRKIWIFDLYKKTSEGQEPQPDSVETTESLVLLAERFFTNGDWGNEISEKYFQYLSNRRSNANCYADGSIVSSIELLEEVLEDSDAISKYKKFDRKLYGIEQEAAGVGEALKNTSISWIDIRVVMDLADSTSRSYFKDENKQQAAKLAADFSLGFIEFLLKQQNNSQDQEEVFNLKNSILDITNLHEVSLKLREILIKIATGGKRDNEVNREYIYLKNILMSSDIPSNRIPAFVRISGSIQEFWSFIRNECDKYAERRSLLRENFKELIEFLDSN